MKRTPPTRRSLRAIGGLLIALGAGPTADADEADDLSEQVAALRIEVDGLASELQAARKARQDRLRQLEAEQSEVERQVRLAALAQATETTALDRSSAEQAADRNMRRALLAALDQAEAHVKRTLPYRRAAREKGLRKLRAELSRPDGRPGDVLRRLFRFIEEEEALTKEIALDRQPVTVDGVRQLVDVVHVGMALLYIRDANERVGWAERTEQDWRFRWLEDEPSADAVRILFERVANHRHLGLQRLLVPEPRP